MPSTAPVAPKKRLALFLDGTWNTVDDNTNIWRLRALFSSNSSDGCEQRAYYSTGLGTKFGEKIAGGMFGRGIDTEITCAYEWLIENFESQDEIFIFGFSRGSYTARSMSGFISKCGLLQRGAPLGVNQLFSRYRTSKPKLRTIRQLNEDKTSGKTDFSDEEKWMLEYSDAVPIKFIGVFDTVGALGVPFPLYRTLMGSAYPFLNTGLRQNNEYAFHALAIDENRKAFRPTLWTNEGVGPDVPVRPIDRTEQRWFVGAHANVGGGYYSDPLAQLPIKWLAGKASNLGLAFVDKFTSTTEANAAKISDSFWDFGCGFYALSRAGKRYWRAIGLPPRDEGKNVKTINETIDSSVFSRWRADPEYRPLSLRLWATLQKTDPSKITTSVRTDDPTIIVSE